MNTPESIKNFAAAFSQLPSIGPRQAIRLAFYLAESGNGLVGELKDALDGINKLKSCKNCFLVHPSPKDLCDICENPSRNKAVVAVVEKATDLLSLERTRKFDGRYLIVGDLKKNAVLDNEQKLRIESLKNFLQKNYRGKAEEIILAINPTAYGDLNAAMLKTELEPYALKLSRLGRGIPTGGEIEFADEETLRSALEGRS